MVAFFDVIFFLLNIDCIKQFKWKVKCVVLGNDYSGAGSMTGWCLDSAAYRYTKYDVTSIA